MRLNLSEVLVRPCDFGWWGDDNSFSNEVKPLPGFGATLLILDGGEMIILFLMRLNLSEVLV